MNKTRIIALALLIALVACAAPAFAEAQDRPSLALGSCTWADKVVKMDWFNGGSEVLEKEGYGLIYDIDTGITVRIKREWGHNHADVEPATAEDTRKLLQIAGGRFSWESHAVILIANGQYVAAAINTMPHGQQTLKDNKYNGQFCLHTTNSTTHRSHKVNKEHAKAIERAYTWARMRAVENTVRAWGETLNLL